MKITFTTVGFLQEKYKGILLTSGMLVYSLMGTICSLPPGHCKQGKEKEDRVTRTEICEASLSGLRLGKWIHERVAKTEFSCRNFS